MQHPIGHSTLHSTIVHSLIPLFFFSILGSIGIKHTPPTSTSPSASFAILSQPPTSARSKHTLSTLYSTMFFTRFVVTALSFGATALAAPVNVAGVPLPVGELVPGGSSLPIDPSKLPLPGTNGLSLPVVGGSVPSLEGGLGGVGFPLGRREVPTFPVALENLGSIAGGVLNSLNGAQALDAPSLLSSLGDLNGALEMVSSALNPLQGMGVDSLLAGASLDEVTKKTQSVFPLVNQVTSKVQSMGLTSQAKGKLSTTVKTLNGISSGLEMAPELQSPVKGSLDKMLSSVGGVLGGLGISL
ncbi:unnamed protein product [Rhizoctonia solani]|uniref:Uncharacterized protein n=1 Tax=Rhizoctonia solani TaxID=456999 RepID=A0A8H3CH91_9AGAM|nr:unnamed protein product [Rhizoctonia solani]